VACDTRDGVHMLDDAKKFEKRTPSSPSFVIVGIAARWSLRDM
jgi:hypothetical protein